MIHPWVDLTQRTLLSRYSVAGRMIGDSELRRYFLYWSCSGSFSASHRTCSFLPPQETLGSWSDSFRRQVWQWMVSGVSTRKKYFYTTFRPQFVTWRWLHVGSCMSPPHHCFQWWSWWLSNRECPVQSSPPLSGNEKVFFTPWRVILKTS